MKDFLDPNCAVARSTARGRCPSHWTLRQRLEHYSIADPASGCVLWVGNTGKNGYGMLNWRNQPWLAHRLAWMDVHGRIPSAMNVLHRCDVRACINPAHLFLGTTADNMRDRREKERIRGRLTNGALAAIQDATGSPGEIAARYGVPEGVVCKIKHEQLAAALKLPRPPIRVSKSDKLLATMEQLQSTLQEVLQAMTEKAHDRTEGDRGSAHGPLSDGPPRNSVTPQRVDCPATEESSHADGGRAA